MAIALSLKIPDELQPFDILHVNGHGLPAIAVVRDNLATMVVVLLRNVHRRFHHATTYSQAATGRPVIFIKCVNFRCNLRVVALKTGPQSLAPSCKTKTSTTSPPIGIVRSANKTQLIFTPFLDPIDARQTLLPLQWFWMTNPRKQHTSRHRSRTVFVGITGFIVSDACFLSGLVAPSLLCRLDFCILSGIGTACSVAFVGICIGMAQRQILRAVATSFDFAFVGSQAMIVHFTLLDMLHWQPVLVMAFCSDFAWNLWIMCWDALLPPIRSRLRLTPRFAACVGLGLLLFRLACGVIAFAILAPNEINNRAVFSANLRGAKFELRPIAWYVSCNMTIFSWAVRIMWRLWFAKDTELVVLDGPVAYEKPSASIQRPNPTAGLTTPVRVAPMVMAT